MYRIRVDSSDPKAYCIIRQPGKSNVTLTRAWMEFKTLPYIVKRKPYYFEVEEIKKGSEKVEPESDSDIVENVEIEKPLKTPPEYIAENKNKSTSQKEKSKKKKKK